MRGQSMEEQRMYGCWLYDTPGIGSRTIQKLVQAAGDEKMVYWEGEALWQTILSPGQLEQLVQQKQRITPLQLWTRLQRQGISFARRADADYPGRLRWIPDSPYGLFWKGKLPQDNRLSVAVIGARECSDYGKYVARALGETLAQYGIMLVSGMARGIDGISQQAALEAGGESYGVLGSGADVCYPASNKGVYDKLCSCGGVLSIFSPGTPAKPGNFPLRNRIVSGLADALVVVEAREKSGTLITVDMALEQGKEVYAVPGRVTDRLSDGCNRLIRQGAAVFTSPEELVKELWETIGNRKCKMTEPSRSGFVPKKERIGENGQQAVAEKKKIGQRQERIRELLDFQPQNSEKLYAEYSVRYGEKELTWQEFMQELMKMCVDGLAVQVSPGNFKRY